MVLWGIVQGVVSRSTDENFNSFSRLVALYTVGDEKIKKIKHVQSAMIMQSLPKIMLENEDFMMEQFDVSNQLHAKLKELSPAMFEKILHSVFEEDEIQLIVVGAVLGGLVGLAQAGVSVLAGV